MDDRLKFGTQREIEQDRAIAASKAVTEDIEELRGNSGEYVATARRLPSMLMSNGLLVTLSFLRSKNGVQAKLAARLESWLDPAHGVLKQILSDRLHGSEYQAMSREALAFAVWLKRFAEIERKASSSTSSGGPNDEP